MCCDYCVHSSHACAWCASESSGLHHLVSLVYRLDSEVALSRMNTLLVVNCNHSWILYFS
jgi:hypothetical protein